MRIPPEAVSPTLLGITTGFSVWSNLMPPLEDVRRKSPQGDPEFAADMRTGEMVGGVVIVGLGVIASAIVGAPYPLLVSLSVTALLVFLYEYTLTHRTFSPLRRVA